VTNFSLFIPFKSRNGNDASVPDTVHTAYFFPPVITNHTSKSTSVPFVICAVLMERLPRSQLAVVAVIMLIATYLYAEIRRTTVYSLRPKVSWKLSINSLVLMLQ